MASINIDVSVLIEFLTTLFQKDKARAEADKGRNNGRSGNGNRRSDRRSGNGRRRNDRPSGDRRSGNGNRRSDRRSEGGKRRSGNGRRRSDRRNGKGNRRKKNGRSNRQRPPPTKPSSDSRPRASNHPGHGVLSGERITFWKWRARHAEEAEKDSV